YLNAKRRRGPLYRAELAGPGSEGEVSKYCHPRHARCDLFEHLQPFPARGVFGLTEPGGVAARARQTLDESGADRAGSQDEYDRHGAGRLQQWTRARAALREDNVRRQLDKLGRVSAGVVRFAQGIAVVDPD